MDLYKLFLKFYRTKPVKIEKHYKIDYNKTYQGMPGNVGTPGSIGTTGYKGKLFTYDLVADPGFMDANQTDYGNYISNQLKDSKSYSEYLSEEMDKLPESAQTPELAT